MNLCRISQRPRVLVVLSILTVACGDDSTPVAPGIDSLDAGVEAGKEAGESDSVVPDMDAKDEYDAPDAPIALPCKIDPQRVLQDVALLASEEWAGRAPGYPGNVAALEYAESVFQAAGLVPPIGSTSFRHPFPHSIWRLAEIPTLTVHGQPAIAGEHYTVIGRTGSADVEAEVVFAGYGITVPPFDPTQFPDCPLDPAGYDDYEGIDVSGKIVMVGRHGPGGREAIYNSCPGSPSCNVPACVWRFDYKARNAASRGAVAMLLVERDPSRPGIWEGTMMDEHLPGFASLIFDRKTAENSIPELGEWFHQIDTTLQTASSATDVLAAVKVSAAIESIMIDNLIGVLPGTNPAFDEQVFMIGAHIDHLAPDIVLGEIFPGADDNASGTAVVLEAARVLGSCRQTPARSMAFAIWNAEEDGLVGSCHYVNTAPSIPMKNVHAYLNVDMVGVGYPGLEIHAGDLWNQTWLFDVISGSAKDLGLTHELRPGPPYAGSDHACFYYEGVTAVNAASLGKHPNYHTEHDTFENINPEVLSASAELIVAASIPFLMGNESQYFRCKGSCKNQVYDECTCDPSDPCGWSHDGRCDEPGCEGVVTQMFDDSEDCLEP